MLGGPCAVSERWLLFGASGLAAALIALSLIAAVRRTRSRRHVDPNDRWKLTDLVPLLSWFSPRHQRLTDQRMGDEDPPQV